MRRCAGCGISKPKRELIRIAMTAEGPVPDTAAKLPGRGVYICRDFGCLGTAVKKGGFSRSLRKNIGREQTEALFAALSEIIKA